MSENTTATEASFDYEAPRLEKLGEVETWAKGHLNGNATDMSFLAGTPLASLTFTTL